MIFERSEVKGSADVSAFLLEEAKVAVVRGAAFGDDRCLRLSYATSLEAIEEGLAGIGNAVASLTSG